MARGLPDYYNPDTLVSQRLANVEEVVTHIRKLASLDNRGRTLTFEHFSEGVFGWALSSGGDGADAVASTYVSLIPPACMFLDAGTDSGGGSSVAQKRINIRDVAKAGFEFSVHYRTITPQINAGLGYDNGSNWLHGVVRIDNVVKAVQIYDVTTPTTIVTLPTAPLAGEWLTIKLVIDFANEAYVRLLVGQKQYDISAYSLQSGASTDDGLFRVQFTTDALDDLANEAFIGHVSLTIDEP